MTVPFDRITSIDTYAAFHRHNFNKFFRERERVREKGGGERKREKGVRESRSVRTSDIGERPKQKNEGYVIGADMENIYDYFPDIKASG